MWNLGVIFPRAFYLCSGGLSTGLPSFLLGTTKSQIVETTAVFCYDPLSPYVCLQAAVAVYAVIRSVGGLLQGGKD